MIAVNPFKVEILPFVPEDARALIWDEFYVSRGRGRSLDFHSPWIDGGEDVWCVLVREDRDGRLIGTLVVKMAPGDAKLRCGMIGYVCVAPERRGLGVGHLMLDLAVRRAGDMGYDALLLWTGMPDVYRGHGFAALDTDIFDRYPPLHPKIPSATGFVRETEWPLFDEKLRGPPAFAKRARRMESDRAHIIVLDTASGPAVAEWAGDMAGVLTLIATVCPNDWWLNALRGDDLPAELTRQGICPLDRRPSAMMARIFAGTVLATIPGVRVLDRI